MRLSSNPLVLMRVLKFILFLNKLTSGFDVTLERFALNGILNSFQGFPNISQALLSLTNQTDFGGDFFLLNLHCESVHLLSEMILLSAPINITLSSNSESPAKLTFFSSSFRIFISGKWVIRRISFSLASSFYSTSILYVNQNSVLVLSEFSLEFDQTINKKSCDLNRGFINSDNEAYIFLSQFNATGLAFSGYFLLARNPSSIVLSNFHLESMVLQSGAWFMVQNAVSNPIAISFVYIARSQFLNFCILSLEISSLELSNMTITMSLFSEKSSSLFISSGQNYAGGPLISITIEKIFISYSNYSATEAISIREANYLSIDLFSLFAEKCIALGSGIVSLITSERAQRLNFSKIQFASCNFVFGLKIISTSSIVTLESFICSNNNNILGSGRMGPCIIANYLSYFKLKGSLITNNHGINDVTGLHFDELGLSLDLKDCNFIENSATTSEIIGCVLLLNTKAPSIVNIENCTFDKNIIDSNLEGGPAINMVGSKIQLLIKYSLIKENKASSYANSIFFNGDSIFIIGTSLEGNSYYENANTGFYRGTSSGIMIAKLNKMYLSDCTITDNRGYIGNFFLIENLMMIIVVERISFARNEAVNGDFLYIEGSTQRSNISISDSSFRSNYNQIFGMVIYFFSPYPLEYNTVSATNVDIIDNYIGDDGFFSVWIYAGISFNYFNNCTMKDSILGPISSPILSYIGVKNVVMVMIDKCIFRNISGVSATLFSILTTALFIENSEMAFCSAYSMIGILLMDENAIARLENCVVTDFGAGYASFALLRKSELILLNTVLQNGFTYYSIFEILPDCIIEFSNSIFVGFVIMDPELGFLIRITDSNSLNIIKASKFYYVLGPVIYIESANFFIKDSILGSYAPILIQAFAGASLFVDNLSMISGTCNQKGPCLMTADSSQIRIVALKIEDLTLSANSSLMLISKGIFLLIDCTLAKISAVSPKDFLIEANMNILLNFTSVNMIDAPKGFLKLYSSYIVLSELVIKQVNNSLINASPAIQAEGCNFFILQNSFFSGLISTDSIGGACLKLLDTQATNSLNSKAIITSNIFTNNTLLSGNGGALYISERSASIANNSFLNNAAIYGGAIFLYNREPAVYFIISDCLIEGNTAMKAGGGVYWQEIKPNILRCKFWMNIAGVYGPDIASFPMRMTIEVENSSSYNENPLSLDGIRPGERISKTIVIAITDPYNQKTSTNGDIAKLEVSILENYVILSLRGKLSQLLDEKTADFRLDSLIPSGPVLSNMTLIFKTTTLITITETAFLQITSMHKNEAFTKEEGYHIFLPISFSDCQKGEIFINGEKCQICRKGYYSFDTKDVECSLCPKEADCLGGSEVQLKPGFWRKSRWSTKIYKCNTVLNSCKGGLNDLCSDLYEGTNCFYCLESDPGHVYQKSFAGVCVLCASTAALFLILILVDIIFCVFLITISTYFEALSVPVANKVVLKVLFSYFHYFLIIQTYEISLPNYLSDYIVISAILSQVGRFWFSMECILKTIWRTYSVHVENLIVQLLCSTVGFQALLISKIPFIKKKIKAKCGVNLGQREFYTNGMYVLIPSLIDFLYSYMICETIEEEWVLKKSPGEVCYTKIHILWISMFYCPLLLVYGVVMPLNYGWKYIQNMRQISPIIKYGKKTNKINILMKTENIFSLGTRRNLSILHDFYTFYLKIILIIINQSNFEPPIKQLFILWIILLTILVADPLLRPLRTRVLHVLDFFSKVSIISVNYLLLWISKDQTQVQTQPLLLLIMILIQLTFFLVSILVLMKDKLENNRFLKFVYNRIL